MKQNEAVRFLNGQNVFFRGKGGKEAACMKPSDEAMALFDEMCLLFGKSRAKMLEYIVNDFFIRLAVRGAISWPKVPSSLIESAKEEASRIEQKFESP